MSNIPDPQLNNIHPMLDDHTQLSEITALEFVKEYVSLPYLPTEQHVNISDIYVYNWDPVTNTSTNFIKYGMLTAIDSVGYKKCSVPEFEYSPDENVSPTVIVDTVGNKFKTADDFWVVLRGIRLGICEKERVLGTRILPFKIFIDENKVNDDNTVENMWLSKLIYYVGLDIIRRSLKISYQ